MSTAPGVLISGCSSGIGAALVHAYRVRGCRVYATARRMEALAGLAAEGVTLLPLDVSDETSIAALIAALAAREAQIDILVNNAGYGLMGPALDLEPAALRAQFDTNVVGLMALTRALAPAMVARRRGCIVNIGSVSGVLTTPFAGAYCASKAAVHALSDALRMELAPLGVSVLQVQPGAIRSAFGDTASRGLATRAPVSSAYAAVEDAIAARARASQEHALDPARLAEAIAAASLSPRPPALLRRGGGSRLLPFLARWCPLPLRDRILARRFGLQRLRGV